MPIQSAALFLTEDCNLRCRYCYVPKKPRRLDLAIGREAIDFMLAAPANVKRVSIYFFGGEPLLEFGSIQALTQYGERRSQEAGKGIHFGVTTNGTLLSDKVLDFLAAHKISINLSIDGGPETQDANRPRADGGSSFDLVDGALDRVVKRNPKQTIRMTYDAGSVGALYDNVRYFWGRGFFNLSPAPAIEDNWTQSTLDTAKDQFWHIAHDLLYYMRRGEYRRVGYIEKFMKRIGTRKERPLAQCSAGRSYVGISVTGDIYPCHRFIGYRAFNFGDLDHVSGPENRKIFLTFDSNRLAVCDGCRVRTVCGGGCSAANYATTGDLYTPSPNYCAFARIHYDIAAWLSKKLREENNPLLDRVILRRKTKRTPSPQMDACPSGRSKR